MKNRGKSKASFLLFSIPLVLVLILYLLGFRYAVVLTDSMNPAIPQGSLAITAPMWLKKPVVGDIVFYEAEIGNNKYPIIHRIIRIEDDTIYTKGDNRSFHDPWTTTWKNIVGVAIVAIPYLGWILFILRTPLTLIIIFMTIYYIVSKIMQK